MRPIVCPSTCTVAVLPEVDEVEIDIPDKDIEIDVYAWDKAHHVDARSAEQVVPFLRNAIPGAATGSLVRWTDDEILTLVQAICTSGLLES